MNYKTLTAFVAEINSKISSNFTDHHQAIT